MKTIIVPVDIAGLDPQNPNALQTEINNHSSLQNAAGLKLKSTFVFGSYLVLIFQTP